MTETWPALARLQQTQVLFDVQGAQNGFRYLLLMSPDKVATRAGDFGSHMGLKLAYVSIFSALACLGSCVLAICFDTEDASTAVSCLAQLWAILFCRCWKTPMSSAATCCRLLTVPWHRQVFEGLMRGACL